MTKDDGDKVEQADSSASESLRARSSLNLTGLIRNSAIVGATSPLSPLVGHGQIEVFCQNCGKGYPVIVVVRSDGPLSRRAFCVDCGTAVDIEITVRSSKESADG